jgi:hypothetical protein
MTSVLIVIVSAFCCCGGSEGPRLKLIRRVSTFPTPLVPSLPLALPTVAAVPVLCRAATAALARFMAALMSSVASVGSPEAAGFDAGCRRENPARLKMSPMHKGSESEGEGTVGERKRKRAKRRHESDLVVIPPTDTSGRAVGRKRGVVVLDDPEDMRLQGEAWRERVARRGRGVKQRTR